MAKNKSDVVEVSKEEKSFREKLKRYDASSLSKNYASVVEDLSRPEEVVSFGVPSMDVISGISGVLRGGHIEVYGKWSSGKTTLMYYWIAEQQRANPYKIVLLLNYEGSRSVSYMAKCGVNLAPDRLMLVTPKTLEAGFQLAKDLMDDEILAAVAVDSLAAGTQKDSVISEGKNKARVGHERTAGHSGAVGLIFRQLTSTAWQQKVTFWWNNQIRSLVGASYGPKETTSGGNAPKFYAYARVDMRPIEVLFKDGDKAKSMSVTGDEESKAIGMRVKAVFSKNKFGKLNASCCFNIISQEGIDILQNRVDMLIAKGAIAKNTKGYWAVPMAKEKDKPDRYLYPLGSDTAKILKDAPEMGKSFTPRMFFEKSPLVLAELETLYQDAPLISEFDEDTGGKKISENLEEDTEAGSMKKALQSMKPEEMPEEGEVSFEGDEESESK